MWTRVQSWRYSVYTMFIEIGYFMVILSFWRNNGIKVLDVYSKNGSHSGKWVGEKQNLMQKETACGAPERNTHGLHWKFQSKWKRRWQFSAIWEVENKITMIQWVIWCVSWLRNRGLEIAPCLWLQIIIECRLNFNF